MAAEKMLEKRIYEARYFRATLQYPILYYIKVIFETHHVGIDHLLNLEHFVFLDDIGKQRMFLEKYRTGDHPLHVHSVPRLIHKASVPFSSTRRLSGVLLELAASVVSREFWVLPNIVTPSSLQLGVYHLTIVEPSG